MKTETADLIAAARALIDLRHASSRQAPEMRAFDRLTLATDKAADALLDVELTAERAPTTGATYHGITYAQCFACGYGTADTTTLEMWNDGGGDCPKCQRTTGRRTLWVLTGGRVTITEERPDGSIDIRSLRLGNEDGTPPDAEVTQ